MAELTIKQKRAIALARARRRRAEAETRTAPEAAPGPVEDKYQAAAREEIEALKKAGFDVGGYQDRILQGLTFNAADEILAGVQTPVEMIRRGTIDPAEAYKYAKAYQDEKLNRAREATGTLGTAAEIAGGVGSGAGLAKAGLTALRFLKPTSGLVARSGASAADAGLFGGLSGFMSGSGTEDRLERGAIGGLLGTAAGGVAPAAFEVGKGIASPIISNIGARLNPQKYAQKQVARAIVESGRVPRDIAEDVSQAAAEGQGMFTVADALGNPGQRILSSVARAPGPGRTAVADFLDARQAGQGRRVSNILAEGFDAPKTAAQTRAGMTAARDTTADVAYGAARENAGAVDLSDVIAEFDDTLRPGVNQIVNPGEDIADDSIEAVLRRFRKRLTDDRSVMTDFAAIQRVRGDISDAAQAAKRAGAGNKARLLGNVLRKMDDALENASEGYRAANRAYSQASREIEQIDTGRAAAMRGRTEDTIPAFRAQTPTGQAAYRTGYVDPLIEQAQGGAFGVNKARPLTSDAFVDEATAMAPANKLMQRQLGRENLMFETRGQALGGSRTADNLADADAMGIDPTIIGQLIGGNVKGAAVSMLNAGSNLLTGNTPEVRAEVAQYLLQRGQRVTGPQLERLLKEITKRLERARKTAGLLSRGAYGGAAVAPAAVNE